MSGNSYVNLLPGDTAPWFAQRSTSNPRFVFDTAAGRYLVLCFLASGSDDHAKAAVPPPEAGQGSSTMRTRRSSW